MNEIYLKPAAKVNLTLNVKNKRKDGYHNLESIFQKITLYDELKLKKSSAFKLTTNIEELNNEDNILYKTYKEIKNSYDIKGVEITLIKHIPMQAGLGGGSTDAASFIKGINKLYNLNMTLEEMSSLGVKIGADVVPCLHNNTFLAEGIGNIITKINTDITIYYLIIKPSSHNKTKDMFTKIDSLKSKNNNKNQEIIKYLEENNLNKISSNIYNDFELVSTNFEEINNIKKDLITNGALNASLTGSGSCIYGIFDSSTIRDNAYNKLKNKYEIYSCETLKDET